MKKFIKTLFILLLIVATASCQYNMDTMSNIEQNENHLFMFIHRYTTECRILPVAIFGSMINISMNRLKEIVYYRYPESSVYEILGICDYG